MPFSNYLPEQMGWASVTPAGPFIAGSYVELTLVYTAGTFGIDDSGMLKISWRTTSDMGKPQFDDPAAANFTTTSPQKLGLVASSSTREPFIWTSTPEEALTASEVNSAE